MLQILNLKVCGYCCTSHFKVALGVCFELKSWKEYFILLFTYLISNTLCKDVTFPLITKLKTNKYLSYLSVNRILN